MRRHETPAPSSAPLDPSVSSASSQPELESAVTRTGKPIGRASARRTFLITFWLLIGPGLLAMIGDNDAGGVISYAVTGATFGAGWFILVILLMMPVTYTIQEMTMRLGMVSQRPFPVLVFERFGRFWGYFSLLTLLIENLLTLVTEFIGISVGLAILGVPFVLANMVSMVFVILFALFGRYWTKERLALFVGCLNVVFVIVAIYTRPNLRAFVQALGTSPFAGHSATLWMYFVIATVGNAVAPWMIFFQGSAVIDKGMTHHDLHFGRLDTALGSLVQSGIAVAILIAGAALHGYSVAHPAVLTDPAAMLQGYLVHNGVWIRDLFALGIINAGFLAAITISLSTSWTFAGVFGWAKSLNDTVRQAPKFYAMYIGGLVLAALIVLIPGLPLSVLAVATQATAGVLIIPLLIFLARLTSDRRLMREHTTGRLARLWVWSVTGVIVLLAATLLLHTLGLV